jgi:catechol 2,3-dioxygenase-like lactoylglutathione lyase family enzyme
MLSVYRKGVIMSTNDPYIMPVLAVEDLDRATTFYRDKLGFSVRQDERMPDGAIVQIGSSLLLLYKTDFRRGENTVASLLVDDVRATLRELRGRGITFEEYDLPGLKTEDGIVSMGEFGQTAWFKDSEGNTIALSTDIRQYLSKAA